jgi:hypothetical protein
MDKKLLMKIFKKNVVGSTPILLKVSHSDMKEPLYLTDNSQALVYEGNAYVPAYFKITLPESSKESVGLAKITMGAVDLKVINLVRNMKTALKVKFMAEYYEDGIFSRLDSFEFELRNISWNAMALEGDLTFKSLLDVEFPSGEFTSITTPGIA